MKKFLVLIATLLSLVTVTPAMAALQVDVTQGNAQPLPIAIPDFLPGGADPQSGANIAGVVRADLERSGLFRPLDQKGFVERITNINTVPQFASWRSITAQGLVTGQVTQQPDGRLWEHNRLSAGTCDSEIMGLL
jgi:TolB protein